MNAQICIGADINLDYFLVKVEVKIKKGLKERENQLNMEELQERRNTRKLNRSSYKIEYTYRKYL